jgi:outer membrane protein TolC
VRLRLLSEVKTTWWLIFYPDRALQIVDSNYGLLQQFVEIARTKYEVGEGLQQDVLLAQLELVLSLLVLPVIYSLVLQFQERASRL